MRPFFSLPLLALLLAQVVYLPGLSLWLEWNRDLIADKLCVNVDKPELMCSGRCFISEQMYEALEDTPGDEAPMSAAQEKQALAFQFILPHAALMAAPVPICYPSGMFFFRDELSAAFPAGVFRPPCFFI